MSDLRTGKYLGTWRLVEQVGSGGIGQVWKAYRPRSGGRFVAVKVFHSRLTDREDFSRQFLTVAESVHKLAHPGIVHVHEGCEKPCHYLVMQFIEGKNLRWRLDEFHARGEQMPLPEAVRFAIAVGKALQYAHDQGMVHLDVKPNNILYDEEGHVYLTDFGVVGMIGLSGLTSLVVRTPQYTAPEVVDEAGDARSDVYSLGIVLYELITGSVPYDADSAWGVMLKHADARLAPPQAKRPDLSDRLAGVVYGALELDPRNRFQTAAEMVQALRSTPEAHAEQGTEQADQPSRDKSEDHEYLNRLRRLLGSDRFILTDLYALCADLGIQYDEITGHDSLQSMPLELVRYVASRHLIDQLVQAGRRLRPDVPWDELD
jgi:serine/threonine-protein kinase